MQFSEPRRIDTQTAKLHRSDKALLFFAGESTGGLNPGPVGFHRCALDRSGRKFFMPASEHPVRHPDLCGRIFLHELV